VIVDVSTWQGEIDWPALKAAGIELAIMKATEGIGYTDPRFVENWAGAKAAGMRRGAYHFARPDAGNDPIAEAQWFLNVVKPQPGEVLALDYEVVGGGAAWCLGFLWHIASGTNITPEFYSNYSGCSRVASDVRMADYPLWLAYPGDGVHVPPAPAPWTAIRLWQYAVGSIPGISGNVDEDVNLGLFSAGGGQLGGYDVIHPSLKYSLAHTWVSLYGGPDDFPDDATIVVLGNSIADDGSNADTVLRTIRTRPENVKWEQLAVDLKAGKYDPVPDLDPAPIVTPPASPIPPHHHSVLGVINTGEAIT